MIASAIDPGVAQAFSELIHDPRLQPKAAASALRRGTRLLGFAPPHGLPHRQRHAPTRMPNGADHSS